MIQARTSSVPTVLSRQITERRAYICCGSSSAQEARRSGAVHATHVQTLQGPDRVASRRLRCMSPLYHLLEYPLRAPHRFPFHPWCNWASLQWVTGGQPCKRPSGQVTRAAAAHHHRCDPPLGSLFASLSVYFYAMSRPRPLSSYNECRLAVLIHDAMLYEPSLPTCLDLN